MSYYYIEKNAGADSSHRVHQSACVQMPSPVQRDYIGRFTRSSDALQEARRIYPTAQACEYCMG